jgi:hypothetical protein
LSKCVIYFNNTILKSIVLLNMAGGVRKNPSFGLIFGNQTNIFNKYVPGSGVGALSRSVRRHLRTNASFCKSQCGPR